MIVGFDALARRLRQRAAALAGARLARRRAAQPWRKPALLWPLFTKG
jgi:hypothetical protein